MQPHYYNVNVTWNKDRQGILCSPELESEGKGDKCISVATPPEFPHGIPGIWSPEHLFTAAISSCFMTTFLSIAENFKLDFISFNCRAKGRLESVDGKLAMSSILIEPVVKIQDADNLALALKVLSKAEAACLISNSVKSKVTMTPIVTFASDERDKISRSAIQTAANP